MTLMMMKKNTGMVVEAAQIDVSEYSDSRKFVQRTSSQPILVGRKLPTATEMMMIICYV